MHDTDKTKEQLIHELVEVRQLVAELSQNRPVQPACAANKPEAQRLTHYNLFEHSPIALWEEDFSDVKNYINDLRAAGVTDLETWGQAHPESIAHCLQLVKVNRVNQAALRLFKASERLTHLGGVLDEGALNIFLNELIALDRGETHFTTEAAQKTLAHECLHTLIQLSIPPDHEADWGQVFVSILDLTERVQAEEARRESENRFQTAFQTSPDAINVNRLSDGLYIDINEGFTALTGFTAEEVIGKTSEEINIWADMKDRERLVQGLREHGEVLDLEAQFRLKDGTVGTGLMSARVIHFGGELCILSITRDITEHKLAQEALRESEENYRVLVENSPDYIVRFDTAARILFANTPVLQGLEKIFGLTEEDVIGRTYRELGFPAEQCDFWEERIQFVCVSGTSYEVEYEYESPQGLLVANWRLIPELDDKGQTKTILSLSRDITKWKQLEHESRKAEVLRAELQKEKEVLALKEQFIATVSHEFRTPLSVIKTSSDLLRKYYERLNEERRQALFQQIDQQIDDMTGLINNTLDFTRAQAGKTEFQRSPLDLEPFCRTIFDQIQFTNDHSHQFEFVTNPPGQLVSVDERLLRHILINLLSNAVKYTPDNARICFELDHTGSDVIFRVSDEGIGIPENDQARLFDPFYRAENVGSVKGSGLGLAIVKQYVEMHGGRIEVESQEGSGSTFSVFLPQV